MAYSHGKVVVRGLEGFGGVVDVSATSWDEIVQSIGEGDDSESSESEIDM